MPVIRVQDILTPDAIAPVPGGPPEVRGLINLRGRIVTVIDMRTHLSLPKARRVGKRGMCVTVESRRRFLHAVRRHGRRRRSRCPRNLREGNPATLDAVWRDVADAVYRTDQGLLVALHVDRLLAIETKS